MRNRQSLANYCLHVSDLVTLVFHMFDAADVIHAIGSSVLGIGVEVRSNLLYPSSALQSLKYNAR